jgi:carbonic anhydrase
MDRLIAGHKRFLAEVFPGKREQYKLLSERQAPEWLFITCSDSRVLPDLILGTGPGDLFITRNAGNVVPITSHDVDGVTATIEYAIEVLKAALDQESLERMPKARSWRR